MSILNRSSTSSMKSMPSCSVASYFFRFVKAFNKMKPVPDLWSPTPFALRLGVISDLTRKARKDDLKLTTSELLYPPFDTFLLNKVTVYFS